MLISADSLSVFSNKPPLCSYLFLNDAKLVIFFEIPTNR